MLKSLAFVMLLTVAACAAPQPALAGERAADGGYEVELIGEHGQSLRTFDFRGRTWVMGREGERYRIRVTNHSSRRIEAVISVDGRDAIDGKPGRADKPGYLVQPWGSVTIEGFRVSMQDVATFRFASVPDSYAAQMGSARDVGVVGVAVFQERYVPPQPAEYRHREQSEERGAPRDEAKKSAPSTSAGAGAPAAAPRGEAAGDRRAADRPGLGTQFGERRNAPAVQVQFERARPNRPDSILALRYNDRQGLVSMGIQVDPPRPQHPWHDEQYRRETARPFVDQPRTFAQPPSNWDDCQPCDE